MTDIEYDAFEQKMHTKYPYMFSEPYGGFAVGDGWLTIIESLCACIHSHTKWRNDTRAVLLKDNPHNRKIPEFVEPVTVNQIKEKFGGLRFYYSGGDDTIHGMVQVAEAWASRTCEECGAPATKQTSGWIKTVCDKHYDEIEERKNESFGVEE